MKGTNITITNDLEYHKQPDQITLKQYLKPARWNTETRPLLKDKTPYVSENVYTYDTLRNLSEVNHPFQLSVKIYTEIFIPP